jgi:hypothetical protein
MKKTLFVAVLCLLGALPIRAEVYDGNKLLELCKHFDTPEATVTGADKIEMGYCVGYISGIKDAVYMVQIAQKSGSTYDVCLPSDSIENGQAVRVVYKWLQDNPGKLHMPAMTLILKAFQRDFPCK